MVFNGSMSDLGSFGLGSSPSTLKCHFSSMVEHLPCKQNVAGSSSVGGYLCNIGISSKGRT